MSALTAAAHAEEIEAAAAAAAQQAEGNRKIFAQEKSSSLSTARVESERPVSCLEMRVAEVVGI